MKTTWFLAGFLACATVATAQEAKQTEAPKGQAIVQVFANAHTGFGANNDKRGFTLDRSYLGYAYKLPGNLTVRAVFDIGKSSQVDDYHRVAYVKHADLSWKKDQWTLNAGLISTTQFKYQEGVWGYRYVEKSFQDAYGFGRSADLGLSVAYNIAPWISADAIIVNGEGYKKIQVNDGLNYGLGFTIKPAKGLSVRLYGGLNEASTAQGKDIVNLAAMVGYVAPAFRVGVEYNWMSNSGYRADAHRSGLSLYAAAKVAKHTQLFARYDDVYSKNDWNKGKDAATAMLGAEFKLGKYVKLAPNLRLAMPKADGAKDACSAYVNCYFGL